MVGPRDPTQKWGIPVNTWTGNPITDHQQHHLDAIQAAVHALGDALHDAEGSARETFGYQSRRMTIAGTKLEELHLIAMREVLDR
jgi:hypothetical protein